VNARGGASSRPVLTDAQPTPRAVLLRTNERKLFFLLQSLSARATGVGAGEGKALYWCGKKNPLQSIGAGRARDGRVERDAEFTHLYSDAPPHSDSRTRTNPNPLPDFAAAALRSSRLPPLSPPSSARASTPLPVQAGSGEREREVR
jgi:hypothetical protein